MRPHDAAWGGIPAAPITAPNPAQADHPLRCKPISECARTRSPKSVPSRGAVSDPCGERTGPPGGRSRRPSPVADPASGAHRHGRNVRTNSARATPARPGPAALRRSRTARLRPDPAARPAPVAHRHGPSAPAVPARATPARPGPAALRRLRQRRLRPDPGGPGPHRFRNASGGGCRKPTVVQVGGMPAPFPTESLAKGRGEAQVWITRMEIARNRHLRIQLRCGSPMARRLGAVAVTRGERRVHHVEAEEEGR